MNLTEAFLNRRGFLTASSLFLFGCVTKFVPSNKDSHNILYLPFENYDIKKMKVQFGVLVVNLKNRSSEIIETPFNVHLLEISTLDPDFAIGANKYGNRFLTVNLKERKLLRVYELKDGIQLTGHMSFSEKDKYLCATALNDSISHQDFIVVLNSKTFEKVDLIALKRCEPAHHDCKFLKNSDTLISTGGTSIEFIDLESKRVRSVEYNNLGEKSQIRHFSVTEDGSICAQSNEIDSNYTDWQYSNAKLLFYQNKDKHFVDLAGIDASIANAELLDFCFESTGNIFAAVHARTNLVSFWNFKERRLLSLRNFNGAVRVSFLKSTDQFVVISSHEISFVDLRNLKSKETIATGLPSQYISISHKTLS